MGKRILNLNKKLGAIYLALLVVLIFVLSFLYFKNGVKGTVDESLPRVVYIDNEKRIIDAEGNDPLKALKDNGIEVFPEDRVTTELILDPISAGAVGEKIVVKRAPVLHVFADNKNTDFRSWLKTIGEVFREKAFPLGPKDIVDPSPQTLISNGAYVTVTRVKEAEIDVIELVEFTTINRSSTSLQFGQKAITQVGRKGEVKKTYRVIYKDGVETSRRLIGTVVTLPKQDEIVMRGSITGIASHIAKDHPFYPPMSTAFRGYKGRSLLVTNLDNGKSVTVRVVDFGPRVETGKIIDLSYDAFTALSGGRTGLLGNVNVQLLD